MIREEFEGAPNEEDIIKKCQQGDTNAFKNLISLYGDRILNYINYYINNDMETAKDLTQETFITVYKSINKLKDIQKFRNWIYTIATNKCRDFFRQNKKKPIVDSKLVNQVNVVKSRNEYFNDVYQTDNIIDMDVIKNIVDSFPEKLKQVFILKKFNNMNFQEVADTVNCSLRTAKYRMEKAVHLFHEKLQKKGFKIGS